MFVGGLVEEAVRDFPETEDEVPTVFEAGLFLLAFLVIAAWSGIGVLAEVPSGPSPRNVRFEMSLLPSLSRLCYSERVMHLIPPEKRQSPGSSPGRAISPALS